MLCAHLRSRLRTTTTSARGFTLLELMVVIALMGILLAIGAGTFRTWSSAQAQAGTASDIEGVLRQTQQRAVTEGSSMCVQFNVDDDTWVQYRGRCDNPDRQQIRGIWETQDNNVHLVDAEFLDHDGSYVDGVSFSPRGTATPGQIVISRDGNPKLRTVTVEGLTGRVTEDD